MGLCKDVLDAFKDLGLCKADQTLWSGMNSVD